MNFKGPAGHGRSYTKHTFKFNNMKTVKEIDQELEELKESLKESLKEADHRKAKSIKKKIEFLKLCRLYIESKPRPEFLEEEIKTIEHRINVLNGRFGLWMETNAGKFTNPKAEYKTEMGIGLLETQLRMVKYLAMA